MKRIVITFFLLLAFWFSNSEAQIWQQTNGPGGANIKAVAINSQGHIFVLSNSLMRSTDGGTSWLQIGTEMPNYSINDIQVEQKTGVLFAIVNSSGNFSLWRSQDNGNSWTSLPTILSPFSLSIMPNGSVFVIPTNSSPNYFISTDYGNTWTRSSANGLQGNPQKFWSDKAGHLFLSTELYLYRSTDSGQNWSKIVNGLIQPIISFGEAANGDLYAGISARGDILFKSTDSGRVWVSAYDFSNALIDNNYVDYIFVNQNGRIIISVDASFILITEDNGKSWRSGPRLGSFYDQDPLSYGTVMMNDSGIFCLRSSTSLFLSNLDTNDNPKHLDVPNAEVMSLLKYSDGTLLSGIWRSIDNGKHWTINSGGGITPTNAIDSSQNILVGSNGYILRSIDSGITWQKNSSQLTSGTITAIDVRTSGEIFAGSSLEGMFRSTDNGITWDQLNAGIKNQSIFSLAVHQNGDIYAGSQNIIYKSTDIGLTWQQLTTNFPKGAGNISSLVVNTQGNIIAGVDNAGVFWSTDNGATWSLKALGLNATKINALVSTPSGKVFAATNNGIFFLDIIPNANWIKFDQGVTAKNVLSLCRDQLGRLFAGTDVSGVFSSIQTFNVAHPNGSLPAPLLASPPDGNTNSLINLKFAWHPVPGAQTYQVTISHSSDFSTVEKMSDYLTDTTFSYITNDFNMTLFWRVQAIGDGGVSLFSDIWNLRIASDVGVNETNPNPATSLGTNYPNPFSSTTIIPFTLNEPSFVTLEVLDELGRNCSVLTTGSYDAGHYTEKFNTDNFSAGMYFVRLRTSKQSLIKTIQILK
jgi:photosystem II stability/assembly factor-like uncharacterized protein